MVRDVLMKMTKTIMSKTNIKKKRNMRRKTDMKSEMQREMQTTMRQRTKKMRSDIWTETIFL